MRPIEIPDAGPTVADVMLREPHTHDASASVAEARAALSRASVKLLLVVDGARLVGTVARTDLPPVGEDRALLATIAQGDPVRLHPEDSVEHALHLLTESGGERIPVVDSDHVLRGLVCFNRGGNHFCV